MSSITAVVVRGGVELVGDGQVKEAGVAHQQCAYGIVTEDKDEVARGPGRAVRKTRSLFP